MFGLFNNKITRDHLDYNGTNTKNHQPLPSSKLYDLCIDRDWQAVNEHAKRHPIDCSYQDFHGHDGGATPLVMACEDHAPLSTIQTLLDSYPEATRITNRNGNIPLHVACHCGASLDVLDALIRCDAESVFCQTKWGKTPLSALCDGYNSANSNFEIPEETIWAKIKLLLIAVAKCENLKKVKKKETAEQRNRQQHSNINDGDYTNNDNCHGTTTKEEWQILHAAVSLGAIGCPKQAFDMTLAKNPHSVFETDPYGRLPLHIAAGPCQWRWPKLSRAYKPRERHVFDALLLRHADAARIPDKDGRLPLHLALANGHTWEGGVEALFCAAPEYINVEDPLTGLVPFLLAAVPVGETTVSLTTVYSLLTAQPDLLSSFQILAIPEEEDTDHENTENNYESYFSTILDMKGLTAVVTFFAIVLGFAAAYCPPRKSA